MKLEGRHVMREEFEDRLDPFDDSRGKWTPELIGKRMEHGHEAAMENIEIRNALEEGIRLLKRGNKSRA